MMIDRYLIGVVTGWVSLGGAYGLFRLAHHYERAHPKIPPLDPVPECRALGPSSVGKRICVRGLGHRGRHRNAKGTEWEQWGDSEPPPRNINRSTHRP